MQIPGLDLHPVDLANTWQGAITHPRELLEPGFHPSAEQISSGLTFLLAMLIVSALLNAPLALTHRGDLGEKIRAGLSNVFGLVSTMITVLVWHLPFAWLGGKANFAGTLLAYVYAAGPYMPLVAFSLLVFASGLPARARLLAAQPGYGGPGLGRREGRS